MGAFQMLPTIYVSYINLLMGHCQRGTNNLLQSRKAMEARPCTCPVLNASGICAGVFARIEFIERTSVQTADFTSIWTWHTSAAFLAGIAVITFWWGSPA